MPIVPVSYTHLIKRTPLNLFANVRKSGVIAITLDEGEELAWVRLTNGSDELIVATRKGMAIRFKETDCLLYTSRCV